jgi:uncharacterized protein YdhG (YjbR/CyaY superfamily)
MSGRAIRRSYCTNEKEDEAFQQELAHYKRVKGTIQFPLDRPIPYDFVEKIVTLLMRESSAKER